MDLFPVWDCAECRFVDYQFAIIKLKLFVDNHFVDNKFVIMKYKLCVGYQCVGYQCVGYQFGVTI